MMPDINFPGHSEPNSQKNYKNQKFLYLHFSIDINFWDTVCMVNRHRLLYHTHKWVHMCVCVCVFGGGGEQALAFTPQTPTQVRTCVDWLLY